VRADPALEVVDGGENVLIRLGPVEVAVRVGRVAVE
jgi:hypothetical protein